jgi:hypothetical protein
LKWCGGRKYDYKNEGNENMHEDNVLETAGLISQYMRIFTAFGNEE